jgi:protein TonB
MRTELAMPGSNFRNEGQRVLRWLLLSLALHALMLAWFKAPSHKVPSPTLLISATLRLITPPDSPAASAAAPQESGAAKAPAISRRLEMPANKSGPVSIAHPAPQEVRQPQSLSDPRPVPEVLGAARPTVNAPSSEAAAPTTQPDQQQLLGRYAQQLSRLLASQQEYPRLAAMRGWEGEVRLRVKVARKGNLLFLQVDRSSGHEILDQHALQLVDQVRLPPFPDELEGSEIQITVPVNYKLKKAV